MDSIEVYVQAQFAALKARTEDKQQGHAAVSKEPSKASSKSPDPASVHRISFVGDSLTSVKVNADQLIDQSKDEQPLIEANFAALERTADPPALAQEHTADSSATESATAVPVQPSQPRMQAGGRPPVAGFHEHVEPAVYQAFLERLGIVNGKRSIAFRTWQAYLNSRFGSIPESIKDLTWWKPADFPLSDLAVQIEPARYYSSSSFSLGLCAVTFDSLETCPLGAGCPWRHAKLTSNEMAWLGELGARSEGSRFSLLRKEGDGTPSVVDVTLWDI